MNVIDAQEALFFSGQEGTHTATEMNAIGVQEEAQAATEISTVGAQEALFFEGREDALGLYLHLRDGLLSLVPCAKIEVKKTQISFAARRVFAVVSFLRPCKGFPYRKGCVTVSFGLPCKNDSPCVHAAVKIREGRWTHHCVISSQEEIGGELISLLREAAAFSGAV